MAPSSNPRAHPNPPTTPIRPRKSPKNTRTRNPWRHPTPPTNPPSHPNFSSTLTLLVGPSATEFVVHTTFATKSSLFFRAAIQKPWLESTTRVIRLPEARASAMELYLEYIYTEKVGLSRAPEGGGGGALEPSLLGPSIMEQGSGEDMSEATRLFHNAARLYILADQLLDADCKDYVVDAVMKCADTHHSIPGRGVIRMIWKGTPAGAPMRRLILDYWTYGTDARQFVGHEDRFPEEFKDELLANFYARGTVGEMGRMPTFEDRLEYHHH